MYFSIIPLALVVSLSNIALGAIVPLEMRQLDCSMYDALVPGPVYTGPCEISNCGAAGLDCKKERKLGCVIGPAYGCPPKFCACTNY
ncbi:hypothetical protein LZ554_008182 [Drepanopeziza brunnea f. sp. 'monogermtubi']|nr:hypothetical protein LZ554_008182 [Drepanopeziza brunnea f. sp. 'monogermtubi']